MSPTPRTQELEHEWNKRQQKLGFTRRAVLFKRFPGLVNDYIHRWQSRFIIHNLKPDMCSLLDVGCGYGRIASEILPRFPNLDIRGVELSSKFAARFEDTIGPCFNGAIQDFESARTFDAIVCITLLMYLDKPELPAVADKLWSSLAPGGRLVCIEPAIEILDLWRWLTHRTFASPTGGSVSHFSIPELIDIFARLPHARQTARRSLRILPSLNSTSLLHCVVFEKTDTL